MRAHLRQDLEDWSRSLDRQPLTVVRAAGGSGKSTLARSWSEAVHARGGRMAWLSLAEIHRDPTIFVESFVEAIREVLIDPLEEFQSFGEGILRALPRSTEMNADAVVDPMSRAIRTLTRPLIVCLDGFEQLDEASVVLEIIDRLLRARSPMLHVVITTRGLVPSAFPRLLAEGQATLFDGPALSLRAEQVEAVLRDEGVELSESERAHLLARTAGWAIAVRFAARALASVGREARADLLRELGAERDLFRYIASELIDRADADLVEALEIASLVGAVDRATLLEAIGSRHAGASVDRALAAGLLQASGGRLFMHDLLAEWLRRRMQETFEPAPWRQLQLRLGERLEARGCDLEALRLYRLADCSDALAALVARCGHDWVAEGHRELAADALRALPESARNGDPALVALQGMVESGRDPESAIERLEEAIAMYRRAGNRRAEFEAFHQLTIIAMNENRMADVMKVYRHALTLRRVVLEPPLRGLLLTALGLGSFVIGRHRLALRLLAAADAHDLHLRERGGITLVRSMIHFLRGDWEQVVLEVDERCGDENQRRHGTTFHAMQTFRAAVQGLRGIEVESCRSALDEALRLFAACRHSLVAARAEMVAGHLADRAGEPGAAVEHFMRAAALGARIELREAEAAGLAALARIEQRTGDVAGAREHAHAALALFDRADRRTARSGRVPFFAAGGALAALVVSETGDAARARRFLETHGRSLLFEGLAMCGHAVRVLQARVYEQAGEPERAHDLLLAANRLRAQADLRDFAPELDRELLAWLEQRTRGMQPKSGRRTDPARIESEEADGAIELRSLGGLEILRQGRPISVRDWRGTITRRLFVRLLVAEGRWLAREQIEGALWPEAEPASARNNLRVALSRLRDVLEPRRRRGAPSRMLRVEGERIALGEEILRNWDVSIRRAAVNSLDVASRAGDAVQAELALRAIENAGSGEFVPEVYDDWSSEFRRALEEDWVKVSRRCASGWLARSRPDLAEQIATLLVAGCRDDEVGWSLLVEARIERGDRSGAARALQEARDHLVADLGMEPGETLGRLARRLGAPGQKTV